MRTAVSDQQKPFLLLHSAQLLSKIFDLNSGVFLTLFGSDRGHAVLAQLDRWLQLQPVRALPEGSD